MDRRSPCGQAQSVWMGTCTRVRAGGVLCVYVCRPCGLDRGFPFRSSFAFRQWGHPPVSSRVGIPFVWELPLIQPVFPGRANVTSGSWIRRHKGFAVFMIY